MPIFKKMNLGEIILNSIKQKYVEILRVAPVSELSPQQVRLRLAAMTIGALALGPSKIWFYATVGMVFVVLFFFVQAARRIAKFVDSLAMAASGSLLNTFASPILSSDCWSSA